MGRQRQNGLAEWESEMMLCDNEVELKSSQALASRLKLPTCHASRLLHHHITVSVIFKSSRSARSRSNPSVNSAHSLPPLLASGAYSIGFCMVVCCLCTV